MTIDKHAPIKSIRVSEKYCPWINNDLKKLIRERDKLKRQQLKASLLPLWNPTEKFDAELIN